MGLIAVAGWQDWPGNGGWAGIWQDWDMGGRLEFNEDMWFRVVEMASGQTWRGWRDIWGGSNSRG